MPASPVMVTTDRSPSTSESSKSIRRRASGIVAANHAGFDAFDAASVQAEGARLGGCHQVGLEGFRFAFDFKRGATSTSKTPRT
jgi:hypothetical protein